MQTAFKKGLVLITGLMLLCGFCAGTAMADDRRDYLNQLNDVMQTRPAAEILQADSVEEITAWLDRFDQWAWLVNQSTRYALTVDEYKTVTAFKDYVKSVQSGAFPTLRQAAGPALQKELKNIKVSVGGEDLRRLRFTTINFRDTEVARELSAYLGKLPLRLHFTLVEFMLDHEDISTVQKLRPPQDTDIVVWDPEFKQYSLHN